MSLKVVPIPWSGRGPVRFPAETESIFKVLVCAVKSEQSSRREPRCESSSLLICSHLMQLIQQTANGPRVAEANVTRRVPGEQCSCLFIRSRLPQLTQQLMQVWQDCFTEDADVTMPFGRHTGREGLADWAAAELTPFEATEHLLGNLRIDVDINNDTASAATNFWLACTQDLSNLGTHFDAGGRHAWTFRRVGGCWSVASLVVSVLWTTGHDGTNLTTSPLE